MTKDAFSYDLCIIGGAGHVGLPLAIIFADKRNRVLIYDTNKVALAQIRGGIMPFVEHGAEPILKKVVGKTLFVSSDIRKISQARAVIVAIGTPVDEHLNPNLKIFLQLFRSLKRYLSHDQVIIIRSTVYPHTCQQIEKVLGSSGKPYDIAYCPERIAQGYAIQELRELPQIVAGLTNRASKEASRLFAKVAPSIVQLSMQEAELAKLFSNAWRYIQFAVTNQFYMISQSFDTNYDKVRKAMVQGYGRAANLPTAGFAAGPCLMKDTMQLAAFNNNNFLLGHAAMMINEGLPNFLVERLRLQYDLSQTTVGILGMAFKADIDDIRDALSYKLGKILRFHGTHVLYSDEYADDPTFIPKEQLVSQAQVVIVGVPHSAYKQLTIPPHLDAIDLWGVLKR